MHFLENLPRDVQRILPPPECPPNCSGYWKPGRSESFSVLSCPALLLPSGISGFFHARVLFQMEGSEGSDTEEQVREARWGWGRERCESVQICGFARTVFKLTQC